VQTTRETENENCDYLSVYGTTFRDKEALCYERRIGYESGAEQLMPKQAES